MRSLFATVLLARATADETSLMQDMVRRSAGKISAESRSSSSKLLETATKMVKNGVTPSVITFVEGSLEEMDDVMDAIQLAHADDQVYIDHINAQFTDAVAALSNHNDGLEALNDQREAASAAHHQCRANEALACAKTRRCEEQLRLLWKEVKAREVEMRAIHDTIHDEWCVHPPPDPSIEFCANQPPYGNDLPEEPHVLSHCFNWERQSEYPTLTLPKPEFRHRSVTYFDSYIVKKTAVELAWTNYNLKLETCAVLSDAYDSVNHDGSACDTLQTTMRGLACQYAERAREYGNWFGGHLNTLLTTFHAAKEDKDVLQMDRIAEFETLTIVRCLLQNVHSNVEASLENPAVPCPTETSDPDGVALTIEQCHSIVTRGCRYAWIQPFDRVDDNGDHVDRGTGGGNNHHWNRLQGDASAHLHDGDTFEETTCQPPDERGAIGTWPLNADSTTAHLCLDWFVPPCHIMVQSDGHCASRMAFDVHDPLCHPPEVKTAPCTLEYIEKEHGTFLEHIASQYSEDLGANPADPDGTEYPADPLADYLTGFSTRWTSQGRVEAGWPGCAPTLVCEDCTGLHQMEANPQALFLAEECKIHESYLAPGQSNLDTFRCLDGWCLGASGRCNGHSQCADGSDEQGCDAPHGTANLAAAVACPLNFNPDVHFQCASGQCIERSGLCNNHDNCGDGSDELACFTGAISLDVETTSGRAATAEHLSSHTAAFHDRHYSFDSLGSFTGKTFIKYHNDDKLTDLHHVMMKIRTSEPLTVFIAKAEGHNLNWLVDNGFSLTALEGLSVSGQREINRGNPHEWAPRTYVGASSTEHHTEWATEWQDTRHKEWDPDLNTEDSIVYSEVWSKTFEAGTISLPGNNGGDGSFLIFIDRPFAPDLWGRHMEELGELKCNDNVNLVYVANQAECQAVAIAASHPFYSFRHNGESGGHKCMSSAHCDSPLDDRTNDWAVYVSPDHNPAPVYDCALSAYWEYGDCGCGGNDQNQGWCGGIGSGNCPDTVQTSICPSGTAYLAEWHPKPYGGSGHAGRGTAGHLVVDGCEYIWHAQYACQAD